MEYGSEKTIIPIKELDYDFVIPRKTKEEEAPNTSIDGQQSVINNSYYNLPEDVQRVLESARSCQTTGTSKSQQKRTSEGSQTKKGPIYSDSYASDLNDPTLPIELKMLFQPLYCKLCSAQLSSTVVAKTHYTSKNHNKKVVKFLAEHSARTGEPLHKRSKVSSNKELEQDDINPKYFHCSVCDLPLTGKIHAESHYMGKNHQKAVLGKMPAGKGHFDENGKWIRTQHIKLEEGTDGIGLEFIMNRMPPPNLSKFTCDICGVSVTSQQQLDMHIIGQRHKKKLNSINLNTEPSSKSDITITEGTEEIYSKYRTPSGLYYCKICDISVNSDVQFRQHLGSKKHMKKNSNNSQ